MNEPVPGDPLRAAHLPGGSTCFPAPPPSSTDPGVAGPLLKFTWLKHFFIGNGSKLEGFQMSLNQKYIPMAA